MLSVYIMHTIGECCVYTYYRCIVIGSRYTSNRSLSYVIGVIGTLSDISIPYRINGNKIGQNGQK